MGARAYGDEVFFESLAGARVEPALGVVDAGVYTEERLVAVDDPGVDAYNCLRDV